jgi:phosphatidyl-myo-inositol dimannoside synthase
MLAVVRRRCDVVITGDALTFVALWPLLAVTRTQNMTLVMGLDITWPRALYRAAVRAVLPRAGRVLAISGATAQSARDVGVASGNCVVLPLGVAVPPVSTLKRATARAQIHQALGLADDVLVMLTVGRLVARKGVSWFIREVLPGLPANVHYAVLGAGPDGEGIRRAAANAEETHRVHMLGQVDDATRERFMLGSDIFIQPNVPIPGDMEGFGLVVIEAARRGTPVVASALEGILDAVVDNQTGVLCPPLDAAAWRSTLLNLLVDRDALAIVGTQFRLEADRRFSPSALRCGLVHELTLLRKS